MAPVAPPWLRPWYRYRYSMRLVSMALAWLEPAHTDGRHPDLCTQRSRRFTAARWHRCTIRPQCRRPTRCASRASRTLDGERMVFRFRQPVAVPSYLIALSVGELESRPLGPCSAVWSEPEARRWWIRPRTRSQTRSGCCGRWRTFAARTCGACTTCSCCPTPYKPFYGRSMERIDLKTESPL